MTEKSVSTQIVDALLEKVKADAIFSKNYEKVGKALKPENNKFNKTTIEEALKENEDKESAN